MVKINTKEVVDELCTLGKTDSSLRRIVLSKLNTIYYDQNNKEKTVNKKVLKDKYASRFNYSKPWFDFDLLSTIEQWNPGCVVRLPEIPTPAEVKKSDREAIRHYALRDIRPSRNTSALLSRAGIIAAERIGIISGSRAKPIKTASIDSCIMNTTKNTNSGFPYFRAKNRSQNTKDVRAWLRQVTSKPSSYTLFKNPLMLNPEVIFHRFQPVMSDTLSEFEFKIRQVWCVPHRIVALEYMYFGEIIKNVSAKNSNSDTPVLSTGFNNLQISTRIIKRLRAKLYSDRKHDNLERNLYSMDYSKFDRFVPSYGIDLFYTIARRELNLTPDENILYDYLRYYTKYSPCTYEGEFFMQQHGISSGSLLTNLFDSWWNLTLWHVAWLIRSDAETSREVRNYIHNGIHKIDSSRLINNHLTHEDDIAVCGDDVVVLCNEELIALHKIVCISVGHKVTTNIICESPWDTTFFLGRYWNQHNEPFQTEQYLFSHLVSRTKRYKKEDVNFDISEKLTFYRIISICCPLSNGYKFMMRTFGKDRLFSEFLTTETSFSYLKEYPSDEYVTKRLSDIRDWRSF